MKTLMLAAAALAVFPAAANAQSYQEQLDARYDRALAAGYKALMLCSGIANAERNGASRSPASIHEWELTGIQPPLDAIVRELPYEVVRRPSGQIAHVQVEWADDMPDRVAAFYGPQSGCSVLPIGAPEAISDPTAPVESPASDRASDSAGAPASDSALAGSLSPQLAAAFDETYGAGSRTTAVHIRTGDGRVAERYAEGFGPNTPQRTWSVAKSIAATLVGAAVHSGEFDVNEPIGLNYWRAGGAGDARNAITIDHALRMATGRYTDTPGNRTDPLYWGGSSVDETATSWPLVYAPGTVFRYANNDTLMAVKAIEGWLDYYPPHEFFSRLGMRHTVAETDIRGDYVLSSQVWSTAADLARLGELYLANGVWNGERLLPENWREYVSTPSGPQPGGAPWGYGAGWWTMRGMEGVPDDAFAARGNRGQYLVIVPSRDLVIVRRGEDPAGGNGFDIVAFTRDVLAALD